jgi:hypothetical protein
VKNMPRGDGTGPRGMGPMTGRGAGFCAGYAVPGYMNPVPGRGGLGFFGRGRGRGRGYRNWYWATGVPGWARAAYDYPAFGPYVDQPFYDEEVDRKEEADFLKTQAETLRRELEEIQSRIKMLEEPEDREEK